MKGFKTKLLVAMIAALPVAAFAASHGQGVNQRQHNQQARIHQGVHSGQLTRHETHRLQAEQRHIRKEEHAYRSDGHLSRAERADLRHDLRRSSRHISEQRHDGQGRGRYEGRGRYDNAHDRHEPRGRYEGRGRRDDHDRAERGDTRHDRQAMRDPGVNQRQRNEQHRIAQGVRSGELTHDEASDLRGAQRDVRQEERSYKSDGTFTRDERKDLHQDQNAASRNIYAEKHDDETR